MASAPLSCPVCERLDGLVIEKSLFGGTSHTVICRHCPDRGLIGEGPSAEEAVVDWNLMCGRVLAAGELSP